MTSEAYLAGPDPQLLDVSSVASKQNADGLGRFYPWIRPDEAARLQKLRAPAANFGLLVNKWKQMQASFQAACHPNDEQARKRIQVVARNDPSDVITFRVPKIGDVDVVNVKNATRWFGLFESPGAAHGSYANNKQVMRVMFDDTRRRDEK